MSDAVKINLPALLEQYSQEVFQAQSGLRVITRRSKPGKQMCENLKYIADRLDWVSRTLKAQGIVEVSDTFGADFWKTPDEVTMFDNLPSALDE